MKLVSGRTLRVLSRHLHQPGRRVKAGALYTIERGFDFVDRVLQLSRELVPQYEVDRARKMLADLEQRAVLAR
jgi:hypothetical protein